MSAADPDDTPARDGGEWVPVGERLPVENVMVLAAWGDDEDWQFEVCFQILGVWSDAAGRMTKARPDFWQRIDPPEFA